MRMKRAVCVAMMLVAPVPWALADVWDATGDDAHDTTRNELVHGADQLHDLAARSGPVADVDWYRLKQQPLSSYEAVVDAVGGDLGSTGPVLERLASDGVSVIQVSVPAGAGGSRALRFENAANISVNDNRIRVLSAGCGSNCGSEDTYRIRFRDTTGTLSRFNNSGTQITLVIIQNTGSSPVDGHINFWTAGALVLSQAFSLASHASYVFNSSGALPGTNGSATVSHNGAYGQLAGKAVAVEPATGFTFDTVVDLRPTPAQGSAGGRGSAALVVTPPAGNYGTVFLGGSHAITYTVRNLGGVASGPITTGVTGPDASQFGISADGCAGIQVPAGGSCTLQCSFAPGTVGPKSASLAVGATPGGGTSVPLSGSAVDGNPVFVTSTTVTGGIGGLPAADAICQARAAAGGLPPGNYVAWLSTFTVDAASRLGSARGFVRTDGKPFTDDVTPGLVIDQAVLNTIRTDEFGAMVVGDVVWTGTLNTGTAAPNNCADWTSSSPAIVGTAGHAQGGPVSWTLYSFPTCDTPAHMYCFRNDLVFPIGPPPPVGRLAFITAANFTPTAGGIAAADALCAAEASGLPGTYRAFLATTTASAASRVNLAGPAYIRVADHETIGASELGSYVSLQSGIWQFVTGQYVNGLTNARLTWGGAGTPDGIGTVATTCNDWTTTVGTAFVGDPTLASPNWFGIQAGQDCGAMGRRIYCVQE